MLLNQYIDHTLLKATATAQQIKQLCQEAIRYKFASVCVNSAYVSLASDELKEAEVKVCTVVGFPLGAMSTAAKVFEAQQAVNDGANEIDMVLNIGWLKSKQFDLVWKDIEAVRTTVPNTTLKVILETCYLEEIELIKASELAMQSSADFIKTSTGFGSGGATIDDVKLMRSVVGNHLKIKASGGIKDYKIAQAFIKAGADRLGVSAGVAIVEGSASNTDY